MFGLPNDGVRLNNIYSQSYCPPQKSTCDISSIRACRDELRELADSSGDSYHGDIFIQLRHHMVNNNPGLVTDEDREFRSPIRDLGRTKAEHDKYLYEETWKVSYT